MVCTEAVPWFSVMVRVTGVWCLSGMLDAIATRSHQVTTTPVRRGRLQLPPDNTNKGTQ
jgi:hypothetical protein